MWKERIFDKDKMSKRRKCKLIFRLFGPFISWCFNCLNDTKICLELTIWLTYTYIHTYIYIYIYIYIYHEIMFYYFLQQNTIKSWKEQLRGKIFSIFTEFDMLIIYKKFIHHQFIYYQFFPAKYQKNMLLSNLLLCFLRIFITQKKYIHHQIR